MIQNKMKELKFLGQKDMRFFSCLSVQSPVDYIPRELVNLKNIIDRNRLLRFLIKIRYPGFSSDLTHLTNVYHQISIVKILTLIRYKDLIEWINSSPFFLKKSERVNLFDPQLLALQVLFRMDLIEGTKGVYNFKRVCRFSNSELMLYILQKLERVKLLTGDNVQVFFDAIMSHASPKSAAETAEIHTIAFYECLSSTDDNSRDYNSSVRRSFLLKKIKDAERVPSHCGDYDTTKTLVMLIRICKQTDFEQEQQSTVEHEKRVVGELNSTPRIYLPQSDVYQGELDLDIKRMRPIEKPTDLVYPFSIGKVKMPGDGNCFFHAVGYGLTKQQIEITNHVTVRKRSVRYLQEHTALLAEFPPENQCSDEDYISAMETLGTWVEGVIILAFAEEFNVHLCVVDINDNGEEFFIHFNDKQHVRGIVGVVRCNNQHYDALPLDEYSILEKKPDKMKVQTKPTRQKGGLFETRKIIPIISNSGDEIQVHSYLATSI